MVEAVEHSGIEIDSSRAYWSCQAVGWGLFAVVEFLFAMATHGAATGPVVGGAEWIVAALDGLVVTHLFHRLARRRRWFEAPGPTLLLRLGIAVLVMAGLLDAIDWIVAAALEHHSTPPARLAPLVFLTLGNWILVLIAWLALYLAVREFRARRVREIRELRLAAVTQAAQLKSLSAQLNPHFLFNCLNGLRESIDEDPARAVRMVDQLAGLLRYSLQAHRRDLALVTDEIEAVQAYLALEKVRFEERLRVRWDVAPEAAGLAVPPMVLQTMVENALKHGISRRAAGGEIEISVRREAARLNLEVRNTGSLTEPGGTGVGLRNARERLSLLYGGDADLELAETRDGQVRARLAVPIVRADASS